MRFYVWLASLLEQRRYRILAIVLSVALPVLPAERRRGPRRESPDRVEQKGSWTVLMLSGRLDAQSSSELSVALADTVAGRPPRLALDLAGVDYLSSMALRVLLELKKAVGSWRGELRLVAPRPGALEVLTLAGFTRLFDISDQLTL